MLIMGTQEASKQHAYTTVYLFYVNLPFFFLSDRTYPAK
jgi:hypothetical protein